MLDAASSAIERAIRAHREPMRRIFATLQPLEAISLLGELVALTINRFPPDQRRDVLDAFCDELHDAPDA